MSNAAQSSQHTPQQRSSSIRTKLMFIFLAISLIPTLAVGIFSQLHTQQTIEQMTKAELSNSAAQTSSAINQWITERMDDMRVVAGLSRVKTLDPEKAGEGIKEFFDQWQIYENIGLSDYRGKTIYRVDGSSINISDRAYFQAALKGETVISDALVSKASGKLVFVIAAPVIVNGRVVGVVSGTLPTTTFNDFLNHLQKGKTGEAYLVNAQGVFITPSRFADDLVKQGRIKEKAELELTTDNDGIKAALAGQEASGIYQDYRGQTVFGEYRPISTTGWAMAVEQDQSEAFERVNQLRLYTLVLLAVIAILVILVVIPVARMFTRPIAQISEATRIIIEDDLSHLASEMEALANGDLTRELHFKHQPISIRQNDEIGQMAVHFNLMLERLNQICTSFGAMTEGLRINIGKIHENSEELQLAAGHLALAANQAGAVTGQIASDVQAIARSTQVQTESTAQSYTNIEDLSSLTKEIAVGANDQAEAVEKTVALATRIGQSVQEVTGSTQKVAQNSFEALSTAHDGAKIVQDNIQVMHDVHQKVTNCHQIIAEMSQRSQQIGSIIETIQEIATQTNLLSLNAAIEAARAGTEGRGFAVVADEVRRLADRTSTAAKEVSQLISGIQQSAGQAMAAIDESVTGVNQGVEYADHTNQALNTIVHSSQGLLIQAKDSAQSAQQVEEVIQSLMDSMYTVAAVVDQNQKITKVMSTKTNEIVQLMDDVSRVGVENSASAGQLASASEEMNAQVEEIAASAFSLDEMSRTLEKIVASFKLDSQVDQG